jgi:V8-like Glu-specific endopeptidase
MDIQLKSSIIRIFNQDGGIVGAGFLISARHAITCAHVVETAKKPGQTLRRHGTAGTSAGTPPQVRC